MQLVRRVEVLVLLAATAALFLPATHHAIPDTPLGRPIEWTDLGVILASAYLACRSVRLYVTRDRSQQTAAVRDARLEGASLAADQFRDRVGNKLAVTAGYSELLLEDPHLPEHVREQAERIFDSSMAAARSMHALDPSDLEPQADVQLPHSPTTNLNGPAADAR